MHDEYVIFYGRQQLVKFIFGLHFQHFIVLFGTNKEKTDRKRGATTHIVRDNECMYKLRKADLCGMKVDTGAVTRVNEKGNLKLMDMNDTGFVLDNVYFVPGITRNIISITEMLFEG